jgi:hypothetical protein
LYDNEEVKIRKKPTPHESKTKSREKKNMKQQNSKQKANQAVRPFLLAQPRGLIPSYRI